MEAAQLESAIKALDKAVKVAGSQSALGRIIGVTQRAVWRWVSEAKPLPPQHVLAIEAATGISKHDLRPDIYPRDLPTSDHDRDPRFEHAR